MRRPPSSALPSYGLENRRTTTSVPLSPPSMRKWLLFYVVLGFYAVVILCALVVGWTPQPAAQNVQQQQVTRKQYPLQQNHQNAPEVDASKVKKTAKEPNETREDWPVQGKGGQEVAFSLELEQKQRLRREDEDVGAALKKINDQVGTEKTAGTSLTTAPTIVPTWQNGMVWLAVKDEAEKRNEKATLVPDVMNRLGGKDSYERKGNIQAPQEKREGRDLSKSDATKTAKALPTLMIDETKPRVRRSPEFMRALDLVDPSFTYPPTLPYNAFTARKKIPEIKDPLVSDLRNSADRKFWTIKEYQHELDRLEGIKLEAKQENERVKHLIAATSKLVVEEKIQLEEKRAASAISLRLHQPRKIRNNLKCMSWRQTGQCDPYGKREPEFDRACDDINEGGDSGYCEVLDEDTGEVFRVMQLNCSSLRTHVVFSCTQAVDFANFGLRAQGVYENAIAQNMSDPSKLLGNNGSGNGIVMVVYPKLMSSVFASISLLRSYNCTLPIELWISEPEVVSTPNMRTSMGMFEQLFSNVTVETIFDPTITTFATKIHAIQHSKFENVLFLDADNVPVRDPTFLFESQEYHEHGAIFWPDFWHPDNTIFNIQRESLLWELVDLSFVDMFEQESGQILINRKRAALALEVLMFFGYHRPNHFEELILAHGDKDLFRLAWIKTQTPFYMMPFPPAAAGSQRKAFTNKFCGMTMVQFDVDGNALFFHRNAKKLEGNVEKRDLKYWTHLQLFKWERKVAVGDEKEVVLPANQTAVQRMKSYMEIKQEYRIGIQPSGILFKEFESCYGAKPNFARNFELIKFEDLPFANLEQKLVDYAHEGALLMAKA